VGRFYAVRKVKLVFCRLMLDYLVEWEGNVTERPPSLCIEGQLVPNPEQKIRIKRRAEGTISDITSGSRLGGCDRI
jgi:hypothetical protein